MNAKKFTTLVGTPHYMAPEVIKQSYDEKCDLWSLGVIAYQLFSQGEFPFDGNHEMAIFKEIKRSSIYLPEEQNVDAQSADCSSDNSQYDWKTMTEEAKDFIRQLLTKNPSKRPSAQQALAHDWLNFERKTKSYKLKQ